MNLIRKRIANTVNNVNNEIDSVFNNAMANVNNKNVDNKSILEEIKKKIKKIFEGNFGTPNVSEEKWSKLREGMNS